MNGISKPHEFSQGDFEHIQALINKLRDSISASSLFEEKHKIRLLMKLEKLQKEIHKTMGTIDSIWALIGEAGIILGKFGNDAKPFVDMIKEIVKIGWKTQARTEELPYDAEVPKID